MAGWNSVDPRLLASAPGPSSPWMTMRARSAPPPPDGGFVAMPAPRPMVGPPMALMGPSQDADVAPPPELLLNQTSGTPDPTKKPPPPPADPAEDPGADYAALLSQIHSRGNALADEQRAAAQSLQPHLDRLQNQETQLDLTPLMALADQWTGSNMAQSYRKPKSSDERDQEIMQLKKGLAGMGIQASEAEINSLKDLASGTFGLEKFKADQDYRDKSLAIQREQNEIGRAKLAQAGTGLAGSLVAGKPTEAQKTIDRSFGKRYEDDVIGGNFASSQNRVAGLRDLKTRIESGALGQVSGPEIGATPEVLRRGVFPQAAAAQQQIQEAVQGSLKATLGAQFTEKEGQQILARTFDPMLPQEENVRRLGVLLNGLERANQAKAAAYQYYEKNGTVRGYTGAQDIEGEFLSSVSGTGGGPKAPSITPEQAAAELARRRGGK